MTGSSRAVFDYSQCDAVYNFTRRYNMTFRGHNLCWGMYNPGWLEHGGFNATAKRALLVEHATAVASYYGAKAYAWDVVNEAISDSPPYALKTNVWYPDVPDYVDVAFTAARSATGAKLFYNDYNVGSMAEGAFELHPTTGARLESGSKGKADAMYAMAKDMLARGVPLDGVGFQLHVDHSFSAFDGVRDNVARFGALGLEVHMTEVDVTCSAGGCTLDDQAAVYRGLLGACLANAACKNFESWGYTDKYTWKGSGTRPLPFDEQYEPKPAANALLQGLRQTVAPPPTPADATITSGSLFTDDEGHPVHAHGAGLILPGASPATADGRFYMVGTDQKTQPGWLSTGVNLYASHDLQHWSFVASIFNTSQITTPNPEGGRYRIERPKVLYNAKTRRYVMWFHLDSNGFKLGMVGVASSPTVDGVYEFEGGWQPDGQRSLDMGLFQDSDGTAWLVRSVDNKYAGFSKLTPDYRNTTSDGIVSRTDRPIEGQAVWRDDDGFYYLLGSHLTGWAANSAMLARSKSLGADASWEFLDVDVGGPTNYNSQSTYVLPLTTPRGSVVVYLGDRWNEKGAGSVGAATYVWLPLLRNASGGFSLASIGGGTGNGAWRVSDYLQ